MNPKQVSTIVIFALFPLAAFSQNSRAPAGTGAPAPDAAELIQLLRDFLAGASRNDVAAPNRFWAEDVIYTSSPGKRRGKADILADASKASASESKDEKTTFAAEDIRIQQYGTTAIVAQAKSRLGKTWRELLRLGAVSCGTTPKVNFQIGAILPSKSDFQREF